MCASSNSTYAPGTYWLANVLFFTQSWIWPLRFHLDLVQIRLIWLRICYLFQTATQFQHILWPVGVHLNCKIDQLSEKIAESCQVRPLVHPRQCCQQWVVGALHGLGKVPLWLYAEIWAIRLLTFWKHGVYSTTVRWHRSSGSLEYQGKCHLPLAPSHWAPSSMAQELLNLL